MKGKTYDSIMNLPLEISLSAFGELYARDYGLVKTQEIAEKINNSSKVKKLIEKCSVENLNITENSITSTLNTIPYFIFSKAETICLASLVVLDIWNNACNINIENQHVKLTFNAVVMRCANLKTHTPDSLFSRFYNVIDEIHLAFKKELLAEEQRNKAIKIADEEKAAKKALKKEKKQEKKLKKQTESEQTGTYYDVIDNSSYSEPSGDLPF